MWLIDFAEDFSGLKRHQIYRLVRKGILQPVKEHQAYYFSYTDIYVLRIFSILKREGLSYLNISNAYECLKSLDPEKPLSSFTLFHDGKRVITILDMSDYLVNLSKYGQLNLPVLKLYSVGTELDGLRRVMRKQEARLEGLTASFNPENTVSLVDLDAWLAS